MTAVLERTILGDHPGDQRRELQLRVAAARPGQVQMPPDELVQTGPFSQLQHRRQARARHEVRIIEDGVGARTYRVPFCAGECDP